MNRCAAWHYDLTPWGGSACFPCQELGQYYDEVDGKWYCDLDAGPLVELSEEVGA